jgi:hypothetical protein
MHGAGRSGAAPMLTRCGACADFIEITQPTTPPSCSTCSRASSFFPPTTTLFELHFSGFPLATHGGWTTEFRAHRATFTAHAPARHGSSCAFCSAGPWSRKSWISCRIATVSVPIATCSGISALPTRLDRPSEFHGHRALFTDLAPARRGEISVFHVACSAGPCGPAPPAATARDFNTEFSPATFSGQPRSCRLVRQSEFHFWSD